MGRIPWHIVIGILIILSRLSQGLRGCNADSGEVGSSPAALRLLRVLAKLALSLAQEMRQVHHPGIPALISGRFSEGNQWRHRRTLRLLSSI